MASDNKSADTTKTFEPLQIMGIFWIVFGIVILTATFFVKPTPQVPLIRGVATNLIAGILLSGIGTVSLVKGRARKQRKA